MHMTIKQATAIIQQIADEHGITDAFSPDLFDDAYIARLVNQVNERTFPAGYTREEIFASWVRNDLGVSDCWSPSELYQQEMDAR
jgi:hypothetical protein